jgi:hypothetical protein
MRLIFEFDEMKRAEEFVAAVKERFGLDGQTFDDADAAFNHDPFPWVLNPPIVHIDRVPWHPEHEAKMRKYLSPEQCTGDYRDRVAFEEQVETFATEFGGKFVGT